MANIYNGIDELIGNTPLLRLTNLKKKLSLRGEVYAKLEYFNPAGSVKDRVAKNMLDEAEKQGLLNENATIVEPTSGNTGIGLAAVGAARGYKVVIVMPDNVSEERKKLIKAYGATLLLTDGALGMQGAIDKANELKRSQPNVFIPDQFNNPANPQAQQKTGEEIYAALNGKVDIFVAGVGTGGTVSGIGKYLKSQNAAIKTVAVEPARSPVLSGGKKGAHNLQGIGAGFIPNTLDLSVVDEIVPVQERDAYETVKLLSNAEGILCGISSGAALFAAIDQAKKTENTGKNIVVLLPDSGDRYLSTELFDE